jgi:antitoxin (DNA-binding transcriptional repressor) of toxin-antitoxin stability system
MKAVDIQEAMTDLPKLVDEAVKGRRFVITKAGVPLVRVQAVLPWEPHRTGFTGGQLSVPDDFDTMGDKEIEEMFYGNSGMPPLDK